MALGVTRKLSSAVDAQGTGKSSGAPLPSTTSKIASRPPGRSTRYIPAYKTGRSAMFIADVLCPHHIEYARLEWQVSASARLNDTWSPKWVSVVK